MSFYGLLEGKKTHGEIKITIPIDDSGAGDGKFDRALKVANAFNNIVTNNPQYTISNATLISNYQNHVLNNADYQTHWTQAVADYKKETNHTDDTTYPSGTSSRFATSFSTILLLMDALLLLVILFSITCVVAKRRRTT